MALKAPTTRYDTLPVYDRTLIEVTEAFIASGQYAPGPLVMALAKDATRVLMGELGYAMPAIPVDYDPVSTPFEVWNKTR
jgi:hypothetical protein